jgi:hypothetical protein
MPPRRPTSNLSTLFRIVSQCFTATVTDTVLTFDAMKEIPVNRKTVTENSKRYKYLFPVDSADSPL